MKEGRECERGGVREEWERERELEGHRQKVREKSVCGGNSSASQIGPLILMRTYLFLWAYSSSILAPIVDISLHRHTRDSSYRM